VCPHVNVSQLTYEGHKSVLRLAMSRSPLGGRTLTSNLNSDHDKLKASGNSGDERAENKLYFHYDKVHRLCVHMECFLPICSLSSEPGSAIRAHELTPEMHGTPRFARGGRRL